MSAADTLWAIFQRGAAWRSKSLRRPSPAREERYGSDSDMTRIWSGLVQCIARVSCGHPLRRARVCNKCVRMHVAVYAYPVGIGVYEYGGVGVSCGHPLRRACV